MRRRSEFGGAGGASGVYPVSDRDRGLLRDLAQRVAEVAALPVQAERARLWRALNLHRPERAMVLAQIGPRIHHPALECEDSLCRQWEAGLRWKLFRHENVRDDYPCTDYFDIGHAVEVGDYGVKEGKIYAEVDGIGAYKVDPVIRRPEDFERTRPRRIHVDHEDTERRLAAAHDVLGDILRVRRQGETLCRNMLTRKLIHLRGYEQFYLDLYDNPDLLHRMMAFLRDETLREWEIYEKEGVLSPNTSSDHIRGSGGLTYTDEEGDQQADRPARMRDMVCFSESQESIGISPKQFDEFVLQYQRPIMERFASVDYGCCEPMDGRYDLLFEQIPHLRTVSVHPWGNREEATDKLGDRYVYAYKPHPGVLELPEPDYGTAERELRETLEIARGCCVSLTMKADLTPDKADRATRWSDMALRVAAEMA